MIGPLLNLHKLPDWPRRMKAPKAAAYVDESESKFAAGVKSGKWPKGIRDGGNVYWYREDLDAVLDKMKPITEEAGGWGDYIGR
jgi:hypothetical protein